MEIERRTKSQVWKDSDTGACRTSKEAELSGTFDMPMSVDANKRKDGQTAKTAEALSTNTQSVGGKNPEKLPQLKGLNPHVHVGHLDAPVKVTEKKASLFALPSQGRYPLDSYEQVKAASAYFEENRSFLSPPDRREYCQNLEKRASVLGIKVSDDVEKYASDGYGWQLDMGIAARRSLLTDPGEVTTLDKLASLQPTLLPEAFAYALYEFDKLAELTEQYGRHIDDAFLTVFGKEAASKGGDFDKSVVVGAEHTSEGRLAFLAQQRGKTVRHAFGPDFASEFYKEPMSTFNSMPRDQQLVLIRMANAAKSEAEGITV